jgi:hypothetical protein
MISQKRGCAPKLIGIPLGDDVFPSTWAALVAEDAKNACLAASGVHEYLALEGDDSGVDPQ